MEKLLLNFLKEQKAGYEKRGLIPTLDLLIEDLERLDLEKDYELGEVFADTVQEK